MEIVTCKTDGCNGVATRPRSDSQLCENCYRRELRDSRRDICQTVGCRGTVAHPTTQQCKACYRSEQNPNRPPRSYYHPESCRTKGCENLVEFRDEVLCRPCYEVAALADPCSFEGGCDHLVRYKPLRLCSAHYQQYKKGIELKPLRQPKGSGYIDADGYLYLTKNCRRRPEHVWVMEEHKGRELYPKETVHHKNGERLDNRIENLELWDHDHPSGQRRVDKLEWMLEYIAQFWSEDEMVEALTRHANTCDLVGCVSCERLMP